jgi:sigma-B regulation protein RsbU (phosphoserine phosphatase)
MQTSFSARRLARHFLALVFAACATTFSVLWILQMRYSTPRPGFLSYEYSATTGAMKVGEVLPGSPADQAGLRSGDRIVAIDGQRLSNLRPFYDAIIVGRKQVIELTVEQPGSAGQRQLRLVVSGGKRVPKRTLRLEDLLGLPIDYYPVGFLLVGVTVLLLRPDDRNAWLLALLFGGFVAVAPLFEGNIPPPLRGFAVFYKIVMSWSSLALFYYFFAVFPASSPIDRKIPWLKNLFLAGAIITTVPIGLRCLVAGGTLPLYLDLHWPGANVIRWVLALQEGLPSPASQRWPSPGWVFFGSFLGAMALGLTSLVSNNFLSPDAQVRRKAHVMVWGTFIGVAPTCLVASIAFVGGFGNIPLAWWQVSVLFLSFVWPLSFAYAVVKHRVLEIPVLLKRSARYLLAQRGFTILLLVLWVAAIRLFTYAVSGLVGTFSDTVLVLGLLFGVGLVWLSAPAVKRATERIDRAFFRSAYDARQILESLVEETRTVTSREELAVLLGGEIKQALHPMFAAVYLADSEGQLRVYPDASPTKFQPLPSRMPLIEELARRKEPWQISDNDPRERGLSDNLAIFAPHHPECLVPILMRGGTLTGLLVLGAKLSEESYSREDQRLLSAAAAQAGVTLENMRLAEDMAARIEAERRMARDMEIAKQVQARLFPQKSPPLDTLEYAGRCIQARDVGGDYYDFLNLGKGRMGIVLADIVGKGIPGALLMANLQADVRSQCAIASQDLPQFLKSVNQSFFESTDDGRYATLFFGDYQDSARRLRFANCGHNPPLLVHPNGMTERLTATATVLGLFEEWESSLGDVQIASGDVLVIYTDGVTEADNAEGEEFGESRLLEIVRHHLTVPVPLILDAILRGALEFSGGEGKMRDDLTLVVARGR